MAFLQDILSATDTAESFLENSKEEIPESEHSSIVQYHRALAQAILLAFDLGLQEDEACAKEEKYCVVSPFRYDDLNKDTKEIDLNEHDICDEGDFFEFHDYDDDEEVQTAYQKISLYHHPTPEDEACATEEKTCVLSPFRYDDLNRAAVHILSTAMNHSGDHTGDVPFQFQPQLQQ